MNHYLSAALVRERIADSARRSARVTSNARFGPRHSHGVDAIPPFTTPIVREVPAASEQARVEGGQW